MYTIDWIMFIIIISVICKHKYRKRKQNETIKTTWSSAITTITLVTVLGLGWGFGLVATSLPVKELTLAFQIMFSLFVGLQGVLIFGFHGLKNPDARKVWKDWLIIIPQKFHLVSPTSKGTSKSGRISVQNATFSRDSTLHHDVDLSSTLGPNPNQGENGCKISNAAADLKDDDHKE